MGEENEEVRYSYVINTQKLFELVSSSKQKSNKETEVTTGFDTDTKGRYSPTSKVVREITTKGDTFIDNLKYDFVKTLIMITIEGWDEDNKDITDNPGALMCLNTLIKDGIVTKIIEK